MRRFIFFLAIALTPAVVLSAQNPAERVMALQPRHPSDSPLESGDSILPFRGGTALWVFNPSSDTVWVDTLYLTGCQNIAQSCSPLRVDLPVPPGQARKLIRLTPKLARDPFNYRWTYSWRVVTLEEETDIYIKPAPLPPLPP